MPWKIISGLLLVGILLVGFAALIDTGPQTINTESCVETVYGQDCVQGQVTVERESNPIRDGIALLGYAMILLSIVSSIFFGVFEIAERVFGITVFDEN